MHPLDNRPARMATRFQHFETRSISITTTIKQQNSVSFHVSKSNLIGSMMDSKNESQRLVNNYDMCNNNEDRLGVEFYCIAPYVFTGSNWYFSGR